MVAKKPSGAGQAGSPRAADDTGVETKTAAETDGVTGAGVHTLRQSVALGWLESGVHIKAVADLLGHSSIAVTGDVCGHVSDAAARSAVDDWSGVLGL